MPKGPCPVTTNAVPARPHIVLVQLTLPTQKSSSIHSNKAPHSKTQGWSNEAAGADKRLPAAGMHTQGWWWSENWQPLIRICSRPNSQTQAHERQAAHNVQCSSVKTGAGRQVMLCQDSHQQCCNTCQQPTHDPHKLYWRHRLYRTSLRAASILTPAYCLQRLCI